jgi:hypothetical protein
MRRVALAMLALTALAVPASSWAAEPQPEFGRCTKLEPVLVGKKKTYHGGYKNVSCIKASPTHTGKYEWTPGVEKTAVKFGSGPGLPTIENEDRERIECFNMSGSGTISSPTSIGGINLRLTGCELVLRPFEAEELEHTEEPCTTPGLEAGEVRPTTLEGSVERVAKAKAARIRLKPESGVLFAEVSCGGFTTINGSVRGTLESNKMQSETRLTFEVSNGGLEVFGRDGDMGGGLLWHGFLKTEEPVEVQFIK